MTIAEINSIQFKKISIRGCVAYSICCLENALEHYNLKGDGWNFLLKKLWWYTELRAYCDPSINNCYPLERWWALISILSPKYQKGVEWNYEKFKSQLLSDEDMPTPQELDLLSESYKQTNDVIDELVDYVYHIGVNELWAGIGETSPDTLRNLQGLIDLMCENHIPLPSMEPFRQYVFHKKGWYNRNLEDDLHGFGEIFDGTQYSKFVNSAK